MTDFYAHALSDACSGWEALRPPNRVSVTQGAADTLVIRQPGATGGPWSASETPYMVEPMNALTSRRHEAVVFVGPARTGKCLDVDTPIPTPNGMVRMGDLRTGDRVFGPDGRRTRVTVAHDVKTDLPCYRVSFNDGTSLVADSEHLWGVERFNKRNEPDRWVYEVLTTKHILEKGLGVGGDKSLPTWRFRVKNADAVAFETSGPTPLDPYLLGLWLGNGLSEEARFICHIDDTEHYAQAIADAGHEVDVVRNPDGKNASYVRADKAEVGDRKSRFRRLLKQIGVLGEKHIPDAYKFSPKAVRIAVLQGLMDSDGHSPQGAGGGVTFTTTRDVLKDDFAFLVRSLGLRVKVVKKPTKWVSQGVTKCGHTWSFQFVCPPTVVPFRLLRKLQHWVPYVKPVYRQIVSIEPVPTRPVRCIAVDNESKLFLAGEGFIPTHNTAGLLQGWMTHNVVNDPGDMLFMQMSRGKAREFSKTDIDRAIRNSPKVRAMLSPRAVDSNTFDILFRHGMWLRVAWPTVDNVSGSTYRYVAITDIDRIENAENVDGEGPLFDLAKKRTTTFMSRGMTLVESSPGKPFDDPNWVPATAHEGPPCKGIVALYNRSTRERFYWPCPDCGEFFEAKPGLELFSMMPSTQVLMEEVRTANIPALARKFAQVVCPHCASILQHKDKMSFNKAGIWVPDGCKVTKEREITGHGLESTIRGFWLGGVAAFKQSWESIVTQYLYGLQEYALTGSEEKLKQTTNTDQGMPYMARHLVEAKSAGMSPRDRAEKDLLRFIAPEPTRAVLVSVDVQGGQNARFDVQVHAVGPHGEQWVIDRFKIDESKREGTMPGEFAPLDPASYPEDWDVLTDKLVMGTWRTTVENIEMHPLAVIVDSGGEDGVTHNAYAWYRRVRTMGLGKRVFLYKGGSTPNAPDMRETLVGKIGNKGRNDIPLLHCNPNKLSDGVDAGLRRQTFGPGYIHLPAPRHPTDNPNGWVSAAFFDELEAETRNKDGTWVQRRSRNETFDHCRMQRALMLRLGVFKVDDWSRVPAWFAPVEKNTMAITKQDRREVQANLTVSAPQEDRPQQPIYPIARRKRPRRSSVPSF